MNFFDAQNHTDDDFSRIPYEEAIIKSQHNPLNPRDRFLSYYAPNTETISKIIRKRNADEDEVEDKEVYLRFFTPFYVLFVYYHLDL